MSSQLESRHFFRLQDIVLHRDGQQGTVADSQALYATVLWSDGTAAEINQFDPAVVVVERAETQ